MKSTNSDALGISEPLMRLIREAIEQGLAARQGENSFTPFALVDGGAAAGSLIVLATETTEEAIATARLLVAKGATSYLVLAFDGFITDASARVPRTEAVHVEAYERGRGQGMRFAQRYLPGDGTGPVRPIGNVMYGGTMPLPTEAEYDPLVKRYERKRQGPDTAGDDR